MQRQVSLLLLTALLTSVGCAATEHLEARTLPFHIAIVPMDEPIVGEVSPGELPGKATDLRVSLDRGEVTAAVSGALEEYCFAYVTVIELDGLDTTTDAFERQRALLARARAVGADMVVDLGLRYDREIYRKKAGTFWLNYPLFLLASPSNWFIGDNGYYADVELTTSIYDLNALEAGGFAIDEPTARILSTTSRYTGVELDFSDRSDGPSDYMKGVFVPSGFLSRESDSALRKIHAKIIEELRTQVVQGIQSRRSDFVRAEWIAPVFLDPDILLTRDGDDVVVQGSVRLRRDGLVERVNAVHLEAGAGRVKSLVQPASSPRTNAEPYDVLPFEARVPVATGSGVLRIECEAGARDRYVRSYTYTIPGP